VKKPTLLAALIFVGASMGLPASADSTPKPPGQETAATDQAMVDGLNKQIAQTKVDLVNTQRELDAVKVAFGNDTTQAKEKQQAYQKIANDASQASAAAVLKKDADKCASRAAADKIEWDNLTTGVAQLNAQLQSLQTQLADLQRRMKHT
jgi:predicted  nucleic acid-binding Zn-ribbon protein